MADAQNIVVDKIYNEDNQVTRQSQPRYVNETPATTYAGYTPLDSAEVWSVTSYDDTGRAVDAATPDGATTAMGGWGRTSVTIDPNGHRKESLSDGLGRLVQVRESTAEPQSFEAETASHLIGSAQTGGWLSPNVTAGHTAPGYLTYGPYQAPAVAGPGQVVRFRLALDVAIGSDDSIVRIDVYDATSAQVLAQRVVTRQEFLGGLTRFRDFALTFDTTGRAGHQLEYRVYWLDYGKVAHDVTTVAWSQNLATTTYGYSPLDLLTKVTDAASNQTSMTYDAVGRKTAMTDPDMGTWYYGYDPQGKLLQQSGAKRRDNLL